MSQHPKHDHVEAFRLMLYRDQAGNEEWIWNSRDGVTPFALTSRQGHEARHADWHRDRYLPDHVPQVGDRIFVDLTPGRARELRTAYVERWWDKPIHGECMSDRWPSKEQAITELAEADLKFGGGGAPDLIEVTEAVLNALLAARAAARGAS